MNNYFYIKFKKIINNFMLIIISFIFIIINMNSKNLIILKNFLEKSFNYYYEFSFFEKIVYKNLYNYLDFFSFYLKLAPLQFFLLFLLIFLITFFIIFYKLIKEFMLKYELTNSLILGFYYKKITTKKLLNKFIIFLSIVLFFLILLTKFYLVNLSILKFWDYTSFSNFYILKKNKINEINEDLLNKFIDFFYNKNKILNSLNSLLDNYKSIIEFKNLQILNFISGSVLNWIRIPEIEVIYRIYLYKKETELLNIAYYYDNFNNPVFKIIFEKLKDLSFKNHITSSLLLYFNPKILTKTTGDTFYYFKYIYPFAKKCDFMLTGRHDGYIELFRNSYWYIFCNNFAYLDKTYLESPYMKWFFKQDLNEYKSLFRNYSFNVFYTILPFMKTGVPSQIYLSLKSFWVNDNQYFNLFSNKFFDIKFFKLKYDPDNNWKIFDYDHYYYSKKLSFKLIKIGYKIVHHKFFIENYNNIIDKIAENFKFNLKNVKNLAKRFYIPVELRNINLEELPYSINQKIISFKSYLKHVESFFLHYNVLPIESKIPGGDTILLKSNDLFHKIIFNSSTEKSISVSKNDFFYQNYKYPFLNKSFLGFFLKSYSPYSSKGLGYNYFRYDFINNNLWTHITKHLYHNKSNSFTVQGLELDYRLLRKKDFALNKWEPHFSNFIKNYNNNKLVYNPFTQDLTHFHILNIYDYFYPRRTVSYRYLNSMLYQYTYDYKYDFFSSVPYKYTKERTWWKNILVDCIFNKVRDYDILDVINCTLAPNATSGKECFANAQTYLNHLVLGKYTYLFFNWDYKNYSNYARADFFYKTFFFIYDNFAIYNYFDDIFCSNTMYSETFQNVFTGSDLYKKHDGPFFINNKHPYNKIYNGGIYNKIDINYDSLRTGNRLWLARHMGPINEQYIVDKEVKLMSNFYNLDIDWNEGLYDISLDKNTRYRIRGIYRGTLPMKTADDVLEWGAIKNINLMNILNGSNDHRAFMVKYFIKPRLFQLYDDKFCHEFYTSETGHPYRWKSIWPDDYMKINSIDNLQLLKKGINFNEGYHFHELIGRFHRNPGVESIKSVNFFNEKEATDRDIEKRRWQFKAYLTESFSAFHMFDDPNNMANNLCSDLIFWDVRNENEFMPIPSTNIKVSSYFKDQGLPKKTYISMFHDFHSKKYKDWEETYFVKYFKIWFKYLFFNNNIDFEDLSRDRVNASKRTQLFDPFYNKNNAFYDFLFYNSNSYTDLFRKYVLHMSDYRFDFHISKTTNFQNQQEKNTLLKHFFLYPDNAVFKMPFSKEYSFRVSLPIVTDESYFFKDYDIKYTRNLAQPLEKININDYDPNWSEEKYKNVFPKERYVADYLEHYYK